MQPSRRARGFAVACQLSILGLQVVLPAIVLVTVGRKQPFVRAWAAEALNLQVPLIGGLFLLAVITVRTQSDLIGYSMFGFFEIFGIYAVVCGIVGARKAWHGETWRYPVNIRIIPGNEVPYKP